VDAKEFLRRMSLGAREQEAVVRELLPELRRRTRFAAFQAGINAGDRLDDLLQEVCVVLLTKRDDLRTDGSIWPWIGRVVYHKAIDLQRHHARFVQPSALGDDAETDWDPGQHGAGVTPPGSYEPRYEFSDCIRRVFDALEQEPAPRKGSRRTLDLLHFHLTVSDELDDLARFLDCSRHAAAERRSYALKKLRELCARFCGDDHCGLSMTQARQRAS